VTTNEDKPSDGKVIANLILNDLKGILNKKKRTIATSHIPPEVVGFFGRCINNGSLTKKQVKNLMADWDPPEPENYHGK